MKPGVRALLAITILALAVIATGCGGSDGDYTSRVNDIQERFASDIQETTAEADSAATGAVAAEALDRLAATLRRSAHQLVAIEPPDRVAAQHRRIVAALEGFAARTRQLGQRAQSGGQPALVSVQADFIAASSKASGEIVQATDEINLKLGQ
jgi:hypothetical protein